MTTAVPILTLAQARRLALAAQGFATARPASAGMRQIARVIDTLAVVQIDSVNVLSRSHYLPFFSRLGDYDQTLLDRARDGETASGVTRRDRASRKLVEYWAHEASLVPPSTWPLLGFRMAAARAGTWGQSLEAKHPGLVGAVRQVVAEHGPLTSREVESHLPHGSDRRADHWGWNWSAVKSSLEYLFETGSITSAGRTSQFERRYAVPEAVLPAEVVAAGPGGAHPWGEQEAITELIRMSLRAHGLGSARCLADYFRIRRPAMVVAALAELEARGEAQRVQVTGWDKPVWRDPSARIPRAVAGAALLSPFDSLVWQRERVEALWGFRYRIEIYTPAPQRVYGYYVLPFLLDQHLVGRVDLKADRAGGSLLVRSLHWEPGTDTGHALPRLVGELELMARWLGLGRVDFTQS